MDNTTKTIAAGGGVIALLVVVGIALSKKVSGKPSPPSVTITVVPLSATQSRRRRGRVFASSSVFPSGKTLQISATVTGGVAPYTYSWNLGDGTTSTSALPTHSYTSAGPYTISLTITDSAGSTASATASITITSFSVSVTSVVAPNGTLSYSAIGGTANGYYTLNVQSSSGVILAELPTGGGYTTGSSGTLSSTGSASGTVSLAGATVSLGAGNYLFAITDITTGSVATAPFTVSSPLSVNIGVTPTSIYSSKTTRRVRDTTGVTVVA